jgi:exopolysaccharide biosynthesis protein
MKKLFNFFVLLFSVIFLLTTSFKNTCVNTKHDVKMTSESNFNILIVNKNHMKFGVSTNKPTKSDFYTNSNFFTNKSSIGLVVVNGKKIHSKTVGGGYFYVVNGKAHISAKKCPKNVDFASQTILWGIDDGIKNKKLFKTVHGKLKRYRTIIGENNSGDIMIISSDRLGLVTIKEIIDFAHNKGMTEGILLDGGTSVDYKFSDDKHSLSFESVPSDLKPLFNIKKPTTYIYGNLN